MKFSSCVDNSLLGLLDLVNICNRAFVVQFVCLVSLIQYFTYEKKKKKVQLPKIYNRNKQSKKKFN
jgi:hypothetical protein